MPRAVPRQTDEIPPAAGLLPVPQLPECECCHRPVGDPLTGLPDRAAWYQTAPQVLAGTRRMALLICDIDRFKSINDAFGHSAGDTVLRTVAAALCADVGKSGQVYRYSGDEFVVLLRDADRATAVHMAARLTDRIADLSVPVTAVDGWEYLVSGLSISIGWTAELGPHREPHELILAADAALLAAKRKSRKTPLPSMRAAW